MTYAYFPVRDPKYVGQLIASMQLGGLLVFQYGVLKKGADRTGDASLLGIPEEGELKEIFRALRILRCEEEEELSDWQVGLGGRKGQSVRCLLKGPDV
jgi:hypothetical protein